MTNSKANQSLAYILHFWFSSPLVAER